MQAKTMPNMQDDNSILQKRTVAYCPKAHRSVLYTLKLYHQLKPESASCSCKRGDCFPTTSRNTFLFHSHSPTPTPNQTETGRNLTPSQNRTMLVFSIKVLIWFITWQHNCQCQTTGLFGGGWEGRNSSHMKMHYH